MYTYNVSIFDTQTVGPISVYVQYINTNEFELYAADVSVSDLLTGYVIDVNTKLRNVKLLNNSKCCSFETIIQMTSFIVK